MTTALGIDGLIAGYGKKEILHGLSFEVKEGDFIGIVGANGCGKTTLLRAVAGLLPDLKGKIEIFGRPLSEMNRKEIAQRIAFVPQLMEPVKGFSVRDMVLLGRTPYFNRFSFDKYEDHRVVDWAIEELKLQGLSSNPVDELSGGEFQRVVIARALAQEPKVILLDEPISHLDIRYQVKIIKLLRKIRAHRTVISTFHDLNIASRFCQKIMLMKKGEILAFGRPEEILSPENIWKAYRIRALVKQSNKTRLVFLP